MSETQKEKAAAMPTTGRMTMVERVTRAIWAEKDTKGPLPGLFTWEKVSEVTKERVRAQARAAIEAMREPTPAMVEAIKPWPEHWGPFEGAASHRKAAYWTDQLAAASDFTFMIDAALAEDPLPETKGIAAA